MEALETLESCRAAIIATEALFLRQPFGSPRNSGWMIDGGHGGHRQCMTFSDVGQSKGDLKLTKFEGEIYNMELFTLAPNLAEVSPKLNRNPSVLWCLGSITLVESPCPSGQLVQFSEWRAIILHLPPTPSSFRDETYFVSTQPPQPHFVELLRSSTLLGSRSLSIPKIRKITLFQFWVSSPFFDMEVFAGPSVTRRSDTVTGHLARISNAGMDIYIGTAHTNYAQTDRNQKKTERKATAALRKRLAELCRDFCLNLPVYGAMTEECRRRNSADVSQSSTHKSSDSGWFSANWSENDWDESESPMARELQETAPLVLLGVCRAWRDIVLAMPTLWSKLHIRFDYFPEDVASEPRLIEDFVDLWLSRAADCPLSISFSLYGFEGTVWEESPFHASRMRDIIHRHSHRIQHLELGMIEWEIRKLDLDSASFPLLQSATFGCVYSPGNDPHPGAVFGNAPQFHNLVLLRSPGGTALSSFSLPWLQLTKFEGQVDNLDLFNPGPEFS
ncbi:hypothetical protein DFH09DRAFT_1401436 [Mycena vulgaris]|nr:hypothetical protein DFH09DRAFT_1401436 [Mycena vulgaris]